MTALVQRFGVTAFFRWYDLWIGAYWDRENKTLYVCPVPMFGLRIKMPWRRERTAYLCAERHCDRLVFVNGARCSDCIERLPCLSEQGGRDGT